MQSVKLNNLTPALALNAANFIPLYLRNYPGQ